MRIILFSPKRSNEYFDHQGFKITVIFVFSNVAPLPVYNTVHPKAVII